MTGALAKLVPLDLRFATKRLRRQLNLARSASRAPPAPALFDRFESLGDVCEFAGLQRANGIERAALFNWRATSIPMLVRALDSNLDGVDRIENLSLRLHAGPGSQRREYLMFNAAFGTTSHTFVREGQCSEEELLRRERRNLVLLKRKFLADLADARRIYMFRSLAPVAATEAHALAQALRRKGDATLLWVSEAHRTQAPGDVVRLGPGLLRGWLDGLATYEQGMTCRSDNWNLLLSNTLALAGETRAELAPAFA